MKRLLLSALGALLLLGTAAAPLPAQDGKKKDKGSKVKVLHANRVYYPNTVSAKKLYKKIGLVKSATVLNATPEYKEIARKGIKKGSAEYHILIKRASDRFKKAIRNTVSLGGYDLIAETGAITVAGKTIPDISGEVVRNLPKK